MGNFAFLGEIGKEKAKQSKAKEKKKEKRKKEQRERGRKEFLFKKKNSYYLKN